MAAAPAADFLTPARRALPWQLRRHLVRDERWPRQPDVERDCRHLQPSYAPLVMRSHHDIARFFDGFELIHPGVVFLSQWRPSSESYPEGGTRWAYAGVGKKTGVTE
jgi:hypothetical protein